MLDVLKPHEPSNVLLATKLSEIENVEGVNLILKEMDRETETLKITIVGNDLNYERIRKVLEDFGAVIHSVDEIVAGRRIVESVKTEQD